MRCDLILLHAPHVYDFRKLPQLYGPVSDLVPSTPAFEMYPMGFTSFAEYLGRSGYKVRIINLALRMVESKTFDVEKYISKLDAPLFGVDLHWLVHANGSIAFTEIIKKYHPDAKVVMGGFSASYFKDELIRLPSVDYVLSGDSTEEPMRLLVSKYQSGDVSDIPNLSWKKADGTVVHNPMSNTPTDISNVMHEHYEGMIKQVLRFKDFKSIIPFKGWLKQPETCVFSCRGCDQYCVFCGGSKYAMQKHSSRKETAYRTVDDIVNDIVRTSKISRGQIALESDIRQAGEDFAWELLDRLGKEKIKNQIMFEIFKPMPTDYVKKMAQSIPIYSLDISPNSHDPKVRLATGINYSNEDMEKTFEDALNMGVRRIEVFFMIGLPKQSKQSVLDTIDYCDELWTKFNSDKRIFAYIGPLSPFLDPGSMGYEEPEKHGYRLLRKTLEDYRNALTGPSWRYALNYETDLMTRDDIIDVTYEAIIRLMQVQVKHGQLTEELSNAQIQRIRMTQELEVKIADVMKSGDQEKLLALKPEMDEINSFRSVQQSQMDIAYSFVKLRYVNGLIQTIKSALHKEKKS
ncbi:MAG: TIGR04190 family B12-binding domain/radical SAM domain protein [Dehalococcoidales bacterium]|nr:TIGR04190 family B12-binding domain/radical SAM domain protein [Dehalococcoidales bacterium]